MTKYPRVETPVMPFPDHARKRGAAYFLVGCTAVGKTAVGQHLADVDGMDILSADSMLVYREMDIGTAKPTAEERGSVVYRGLDLVDPHEDFSTGRYLDAAAMAFGEAERMQIVVGGTGLYVKGLTEGFDAVGPPDPIVRASVRALFDAEGLEGVQEKLRREFPAWWDRLEDPQNPRRVCRALEQALSGTAAPVKTAGPRAAMVGLTLSPKDLNERIEHRVQTMYQSGLLEEVERLREGPGDFSVTAAGAIGYGEAMAVIDGKLSRQDAMSQTAIRTRRLAKRQRTWFRHQANVHWVEVGGRTVEQVAAEVRAAWRRTGPTPVRRTHE